MKTRDREARIIAEADHIIETKCTIRECARKFGVSKSCIHVHMCRYLPYIDNNRYKSVRAVLDYNKSQRHIRGGKTTKALYSHVARFARTFNKARKGKSVCL